MKCKYCGKEIIKMDVDFNFKGNYDIYWDCPLCCACIQKIRFGRPFVEEWVKVVKDVKN